MDTTAHSTRGAANLADAVAGGAMRSVGFTVSPGGKTGKALVAETALQKARGLRGGELTSHDAMLFPYPADTTTPMTMRGVHRDLEVAWFDEAGGHLGNQLMPHGMEVVAPPGPYRHAMEFEVGGLKRLGVTDGSRVTFEDDGAETIPVPNIDPGGGWAPPEPEDLGGVAPKDPKKPKPKPKGPVPSGRA